MDLIYLGALLIFVRLTCLLVVGFAQAGGKP